MKENILKVTANKKVIIIASCISLFDLLILVLFLVFSIERAVNPAANSSYLYPYGYGLYARNFSIMIGVMILLLIILLFFILRKKGINYIIPIYLILPILLVSFIVYFVVAIKETRSLASYTQDSSHYQEYDDVITDDLELIADYLPEQENINKYEYLLHEHQSIWGGNYLFSMFIETNFDSQIIDVLTNDENILKIDNYQSFERYEFQVYKDNIDKLYILVDEANNKIIYAVEGHVDIFQQ